MGRKQRRKQEETLHRAAAAKEPARETSTHDWHGETSRLLVPIGLGLIALLTLLIYSHSLSTPTMEFDDVFYLLRNPYVNVAHPFSMLGPVWTAPYFGFFNPVTTTSWLFDRALAGQTQPFDFHPFRAMQLVYNVACAGVLIFLFRRLGLPWILAVLGSVLFAVHPIHVEAVAWLAGRNNLTSMILLAGAVAAYLWARDSTTPNQWRLRHAATLVLTLLAILAKPVAVIIPVLLIAWEFCAERSPKLTFQLSAIFLLIGGPAVFSFRSLLVQDPYHGGWLIGLLLVLIAAMMAAAPRVPDVTLRSLAPPFVVHSLIFGAGCAWTMWAQVQAGAIKGGLPLIPTLNLTFDVMLRYAGKVLLPFGMSPSYIWKHYPYVSLQGICGFLLVLSLAAAGLYLARSGQRPYRLTAFGIFWYLIAYLPVSNLIPTSIKMADRYQFVPSAGAILAILALLSALPRSRQTAICGALGIVILGYTAWSYQRAQAWAGPNPDLTLWTSAVATNPDDHFALTSLALVYLRMEPPQPDQALPLLNHALEVVQTTQAGIPGGLKLDFSQTLGARGDAYLALARAVPESQDPATWRRAMDLFQKSAENFQEAAKVPWGFAPGDARLQRSLANALEGWAVELDRSARAASPAERPGMLQRRDELRAAAEEAFLKARRILVAGNVSHDDPDFAETALDAGSTIFHREETASPEEKPALFRKALARYQELEPLLPGDPRLWLYEGLCDQRLRAVVTSPEEKAVLFDRGKAAFQKAIALHTVPPGYAPMMPYRALATMYFEAADYQGALGFLKQAQQMDPVAAQTNNVNRDIATVERLLANH